MNFIKATYDGFAPVLDSPLVERMSEQEYKIMYKMLAKSAISGIDFTSKMKDILHLEVTDKNVNQPVKEPLKELPKQIHKEPSSIPDRKYDKKEEPWVI